MVSDLSDWFCVWINISVSKTAPKPTDILDPCRKYSILVVTLFYCDIFLCVFSIWWRDHLHWSGKSGLWHTADQSRHITADDFCWPWGTSSLIGYCRSHAPTGNRHAQTICRWRFHIVCREVFICAKLKKTCVSYLNSVCLVCSPFISQRKKQQLIDTFYMAMTTSGPPLHYTVISTFLTLL